MNRITISIVLLFLIVIGLNIDNWFGENTQKNQPQREEVWQPNYQAKGMRSTLYNEQGDIHHQVYAEQMEHYELLGFTLFQRPQYTILAGEQKSPWQIRADEGTLYEDNRLHLEKNVQIKAMSDDGFIQTINTEFIELDLDAKTLNSDQLVTISGSEFTIRGNGLTANLNTRTYELINHVHSTFSPNLIH